MLHRPKLLLSLATFGLALAGVAPGANAAVILDDFNLPSPGVSCINLANCVDTHGGVGAFSATRTATATNATEMSINLSGSSQFVYEDDGSGSLLVSYALGGKDIVQGGTPAQMLLDVLSTTIASLDLTIDDGSNPAHTETIALSAGLLVIPLQPFITAGVDLSSVDSISFAINNESGRLVLDTASVPEPGSAGMLLLGLLGLARAGRRARA